MEEGSRAGISAAQGKVPGIHISFLEVKLILLPEMVRFDFPFDPACLSGL
jgi:hypothetical protein